MNEDNLVQKYFHITQISWLSCLGISVWLTLSMGRRWSLFL